MFCREEEKEEEEEEEEEEDEQEEERTAMEGHGKTSTALAYCVTGATGYLGSWLVKSLLRRGYEVHAAVRDPAKSLHLLSTWDGGERLKLFRASLQDDGSYDEAVEGCNGVFHVAASMQFDVHECTDAYVHSNIIDPAVRGTLNLLKSCLKSKSVRRVVFTSSISTVTAKDSAGNWRDVVDESCQTPIDHVWKTRTSGWVYVLSKLLTEEAAFQFAREKGIDIVSVVTATVGGPFLTSSVPSSTRVLLSPVTGEVEMFRILSAVNSRMGSVGVVHIEDVCNGHIFLMEHAKAEGKYICCAESCPMSKLIRNLAKNYPRSDITRLVDQQNESVPAEISSKKLRDLGFSYEHRAEDIIHETVTACINFGFLPPLAT
ncbi:putative anthocyanidin reductase isoform X2 [Rhodamnia argentea]|uniref:Anthocyanidin reductase isoform X2 n=1 Tax=Rhodamnia argentea TaxID=178133 RepID=A0A8B8NG05_9MYRT|nr:putative anthocyanidin reductase isoform X2 [Rhodamnia argentea]